MSRMSVISKLATSLNRRDEIPNQVLAKQIVTKKDTAGVKELIENLANKNKGIQNDCIKVLYEIGELKPSLIVEYLNNFIALLNSKNNRLQWGGMAAIDAITLENPKAIYSVLSKLVLAADHGSVITRDRAVNILIKLCSVKQYAKNAFSLLSEQFLISPINQLAMYAERTLPIINDECKVQFIKVLNSRLPDIERDTMRKRIEKVIKKIS
jgi:malate synthase